MPLTVNYVLSGDGYSPSSIRQVKYCNDVLVTDCLLFAIDMASFIGTRDAALFLPYRSAFRSLNNIIGLPTLVFRLMGREIAVEHQDSVSITCLLSA